MIPVTSGVLQGPILEPALFNTIIRDLMYDKFVDNTKMREAVDSLEGTEALQKDLGKLD